VKAQALVVAWHFLLPSYSSCLSRHHTHRDLLAASYLLSSSLLAPSLTSYSSLCIVQLPGVSVTLRAALTLSQSSPSYSPHLTCNHTRHVLLAIVLAAGTLIDIILAASYLLSFSPLAPSLTSYLSRCIVQLPAVCHSESCANHVTKLAIILAVSYLQSFSPCPTCYRPCRRRCAHHHPPHSCHAHRVVLIASCSSRHAHRVVLIASCSSRRAHRVVLIASCSSRLAHRVVLIASCSSRRTHHVVLITSCSSRHAHRVVLNTSCRICQLSFASARSVVVAYIDVH